MLANINNLPEPNICSALTATHNGNELKINQLAALCSKRKVISSSHQLVELLFFVLRQLNIHCLQCSSPRKKETLVTPAVMEVYCCNYWY